MKKLLLLVLCVLLCGYIYAEKVTVASERFAKYGIQDGLANNIVFDIAQDKDGYIWCATEEGLSRFDGTTFVNYRWSLDDLKSNHVALRILCDENLIYVATHFGLLCYDANTHRYADFKIVDGMEGVQGCQVRAIIKSRRGGVWIGSYGRGVFYYDPATRRCDRLNCRLSDDRVLSLCEGDDGILYVGTHFGGLNVVDLKNNIVTCYGTANKKLPDDQIEAIYRDRSGCLWIGTWNGLMCLRCGDLQPVGCGVGFLRSAKVNSITEDANGDLWIGTEEFLCRLPLNGDSMPRCYYESQSGTGISYRTVRVVFCDRDDNIWVGTYGYGLNFINKIKQRFNYISDDADSANCLPYKRVSSISEDLDGSVWIATDGGGMAHWDVHRNVFSHCGKSMMGLSDNAALCSLVDSDGDLWVGTYNCVLNRKKKNTSKFIQYEHDDKNPFSLVHSDVTCLYEDSAHRIWVGQRAGLSYFDKSTERFTVVEPLRWIQVTEFCEYDGSLIVSTLDGVYKYDFSTGNVTLLSEKLRGVPVNALTSDVNECLWLGTDGRGLWLYSSATDSVCVYDESNGLVSSVVQAFVEDGDYIWFTTNRSISSIEVNNCHIENYSYSDGVQPGMFLRNSGVRLSNGLVVFGGTEGLNIFNPDDIIKDSTPVPLVFTNFLVFNQKVDICGDSCVDSPLMVDINSADKIELDYDESLFTIEYLGINYASPEKICYAYRLDGIDEDWNWVENARSVTYRNLRPGTYKFRVMASAADGTFDIANQRALTIVIRPPFYLTWWAYIIYFALFVGLLYLVWYFVTMRMRVMSRINSERLQKQKQEELYQEKLQFFTNVSHELKTPLTLILAPLDKLMNEEADVSKRHLLSVVKKNAIRVIKSVNDIIDLRKIDRGQLKLKVSKVNIVPLLGEVASSFEYISEEKNINFQYNVEQDVMEGWVCWNFIDKIVYNLLSNAFKFTKDYGEIMVNVSTFPSDEYKMLKIEVSDTGIGMEQGDISHIFERFYQADASKKGIIFQGSGIGLHLVKELIDLHRGTITVNSRVGVGTIFTITLPFTRNAYSRAECAENAVAGEDARYKLLVNESLQNDSSISSEDHSESENRYKILIVEDEADIRRFVMTDLQQEYDVYEASDGVEALEVIQKHGVDLIVSDVVMPRMDGIELCRRVKEDINTCHIPVILLTAKDSHEDRLVGLEAGADSYIPKPFDMRHLRIRITRLIRHCEQMKEKFVKKIALVPDSLPGKPEGDAVALSADEVLMQKITQYIIQNISDSDLNGEIIADHVAMSRMNLHRKLKTLVGLSAGDLIRTIRLETARKQLEQTSKTITEISYDVGFSSPSYFYICFNKKYGVSPSEYRNGNKTGQDSHE